MAKVKTHPWDPADHIVDGEHVLAYLHVITKEEYDPYVTPYFLDCIARSKVWPRSPAWFATNPATETAP